MANLIPLEKTSVNYSWKLEVIDEAVDFQLLLTNVCQPLDFTEKSD